MLNVFHGKGLIGSFQFHQISMLTRRGRNTLISLRGNWKAIWDFTKGALILDLELFLMIYKITKN